MIDTPQRLRATAILLSTAMVWSVWSNDDTMTIFSDAEHTEQASRIATWRGGAIGGRENEFPDNSGVTSANSCGYAGKTQHDVKFVHGVRL